MRDGSDASGPFTGWRAILEDRTRQSIDALARIPSVRGLILGGSVGRGEAWPLSDVDILPIYADDGAEEAVRAVEAARVALQDWWAAEAYGGASLDVGKLRFTRDEVADALSHPPQEAARYLDDPRWFHSLDKGYRSRAAFDPDGLAMPLARWLTEARFTPAVVQARQRVRTGQMMGRAEEARAALDAGDHVAAAVALREGLHTLIPALMEGWGQRDTSFGRLGTRFERAAAARSEEALAAAVFALLGLSPDRVTCGILAAPAGVQHRHRMSLAARAFVGEPVTAAQDARDVLFALRIGQIRRSPPPYTPWIGLETDGTTLAGHIAAYRRVLAHGALSQPEV